MPLTEGDAPQRSKKRPAGPKTYKQKPVPKDDFAAEKAVTRSRQKKAQKQTQTVLPNGETFSAWFGRRFNLVGERWGNLPLPYRLALASSGMSDEAIDKIGRVKPQVESYARKKLVSLTPNPTMEGPAVPQGFTPQDWAERLSVLSPAEREELGIRATPDREFVRMLLLTLSAGAPLVGPLAGGASTGAFGAAKVLAGRAPASAEAGAASLKTLASLVTTAEAASAISGLTGGPDPVTEGIERLALQPAAAGLNTATSLIPGGRKPVSFETALNNARRLGSGAVFSQAVGVNPSSGLGKTLAAGFEIFGQFKVSPGAVASKVHVADKLTARVPRAHLATKRRSMLERALVRAMSADDPAEIVFSSPGKLSQAASKSWKDFEKYRGNYNALRRLYPDLAKNPVALETLMQARTQNDFGEAMASLLRGETPTLTRTGMLGRAAKLEEELSVLDARLSGKPVDLVVTTPAASGQAAWPDTLRSETGAPGQIERWMRPGKKGMPPSVVTYSHFDEDGVLDGFLDFQPANDMVGVYVRPDRQRKGIAKSLIEKARKDFPNADVRAIARSQDLTEAGAALAGRFAGRKPPPIPAKDITGKTPQARRVLEKQREALAAQVERLRKAADEPAGQVFLHAIPDKTIFDSMRVSFRSSDSGFFGKLGRLADKDWARNIAVPWFVHLPKKGLSLVEGVDSVEDFDRMARLLNINRKTVDDLSNRFLNASSFAERRDVVVEMLNEGKKRLPPAIADRLVQAYDSPADSIYWIDRAGRRVSNWVKKRKNGFGDTVDYEQPIFFHQLAQEFPLPNVRGIIEARTPGGRLRLRMKQSGRLAGGLAETWKAANHVLNFATAGLWAPLQLFRLGWALKITGEERIRMIATGLPRSEDNVLSLFGRIKNWKTLDIPEDALTDVARGMLGERLPAKGLIRRGEKGYEFAVRDELLALSQDPVVRHLLRFGKDDTVAWLEKEGAFYKNSMSRVFDGIEGGADARKWVEVQEKLLKERFDPDVLDIIKTGKVDGVSLDGGGIIGAIERTSAKLPSHARQYGDYWRLDGGLIGKGANLWFKWAGSQATNVLNRSRAFSLVYEGELRRLSSFGLDAGVAEKAAKEYAARTVRDLLYDSAERAAQDVLLRTISPFFPAWKEVLRTWGYKIPSQFGHPLIGHAVFARKFAVAKQALEENDLIYKDDLGWMVRTPLGDVALQSVNILGNWPIGGPAISVAASKLAKSSERWESFLKPLQPFGVEANLGPVALNRLWMGIVKTPPPWEVFSKDYQEQMWAGSQIDWMRAEGLPRLKEIQVMPADTAEQRRAVQVALEKWQDEAKSGAARYFLERGVKGWVLPFQPRMYWKGQKEWFDFQKTLDGVSDERFSKVRAFLEENPELELFNFSKSLRIEGEYERDSSINEYWAALRKGDVRRYSVEEWSQLALFLVNYNAARNVQRSKIADLGGSAKDWLENAYEWQQANREFSDKIWRLRIENRAGYNLWRERVEASARRQEKPLPTVNEEQIIEFSRSASLIFDRIEEMDPTGSEFDLAGFKSALADLKKAVDIDRFYRDPADVPPGPEQDIATYFDTVYGPYWDRIAELREPIENPTATDLDKERAYQEIQRYRDGFESGDMPNPEAVSFAFKSPEKQEALKRKWAAGTPKFLTKFQREELGLPDASDFWDQVRDAEIEYEQYRVENGISKSSKEWRDTKAALDEWKLGLAASYGLENEVALEEAPRYRRLEALGFLPDSFERVKEVADAAHAYLEAAEVGVGSQYGGEIFRWFLDWFVGYLESDPQAKDDYLRLAAAAPESVRKRKIDEVGFMVDGPFAWLFFRN